MLGTISLLYTLLAISLVVGKDSDSCDKNEYEYGCQCLRFVFEPQVNWRQASTICREDAGQLVTIKDEKKQRFIADILAKTATKNGVWMGATYVGGKEVFKWVDGTPLTYTNWADDEPDRTSFQSCLLLHRTDSWEWWDFACNYEPYSYICERNLTCNKSRPPSGLQTNEVIGIVVGGVVAIICFFAVVFLLINCCRAAVSRKRHHKAVVELREVQTADQYGEDVPTSIPMIPPPEASTSQLQENDLDRMSTKKKKTPLLAANVVVTTPEVTAASSSSRGGTIKISNVPPSYEEAVGGRRGSSASIDDNYITANTDTHDVKHSADTINKL